MATLRCNLPTCLTFSRIVLIPFFVFVTPRHPLLGALIFLAAAATDFLDGYFARLSGQVTTFGVILDPIADKFLVISALILLVSLDSLAAWIAITIIVREFLITALRVVALSRDIVIQAEMGGKMKTLTQMAAILCLIVKDSFGFVNLSDIGTGLVLISLALAIVSAVQYTIHFWRKV